MFARARAAWRDRTDVPFVRYGALVRYLSGQHVFDYWWDAYYRVSDGAIALEPLHDVPEERRRLAGVPFGIFGVKIFDTNPDAEPIRIDDPRIPPVSSFGVLTRFAGGGASPPPPAVPSAQPSYEFRQITRVETTARDYRIIGAGSDTIDGLATAHLALTPLRDPNLNRLRDLWVDPHTYRTVRLRVQGLFSGKPYDGIAWTVSYVLIDGRNYIGQIEADAPLHFGLDTTIPKYEFDFVDYHFPADVPRFTFDRSPLSSGRS